MRRAVPWGLLLGAHRLTPAPFLNPSPADCCSRQLLSSPLLPSPLCTHAPIRARSREPVQSIDPFGSLVLSFRVVVVVVVFCCGSDLCVGTIRLPPLGACGCSPGEIPSAPPNLRVDVCVGCLSLLVIRLLIWLLIPNEPDLEFSNAAVCVACLGLCRPGIRSRPHDQNCVSCTKMTLIIENKHTALHRGLGSFSFLAVPPQVENKLARRCGPLEQGCIEYSRYVQSGLGGQCGGEGSRQTAITDTQKTILLHRQMHRR